MVSLFHAAALPAASSCAQAQVVGAQLVEAADADAQFECDRFGREQAGADLGEEVGQLLRALRFFMARTLVSSVCTGLNFVDPRPS